MQFNFTCIIHVLIQILCYWTLFIVPSLSKNNFLFILQNTRFRRLDSVSETLWFVPTFSSVVLENIGRPAFQRGCRFGKGLESDKI
jgi:hypothetical protein